MTGRTLFSGEEWDLLVKLPRWVVRAASASQPDSARRTAIEVEAGFLSVAEGRENDSELVREIAEQTLRKFDDPSHLPEAAGISFNDLETGLAGVLDRAQIAIAVMNSKAPGDTPAYRRWLLDVCEVVIRAAKSHDVFGIGGVYVTESEHAFDRRLARTIDS